MRTTDLNQVIRGVAWISLMFAGFLLFIHVSMQDTFPYSARPLEIRYPQARLLWNLSVQMVSTGLLGWYWQEANPVVTLRQFYTMLGIALLAVLGSAVVNMVYNTSLCCENPLATYWGFPFSWLVGIAQDPPFDRFDHWTTFAYVSHFAGQMRWRINPWKFVADFLFWWAIVVPVGLLLWRQRQ